MSSPLVSVIVPVYNVAEYLGPCLDSLLAQTLDDLEVLVVDDGSTDDSHAIAERYVTGHADRIRLITKPNGGLGDARNTGIDAAAGRYLAFVDGDDLAEPEMLSRMVARAVGTGADFVICGIESFTAAGAVSYLPEPDMSVFGHSLSEEPRLLYRVDASACDKLIDRELVERSGIRFPVGVAFEDLPTVYRWLAFAKRVEKVDEPLYRYRRDRTGSITGDKGERYLELIGAFSTLDDFFADAGLSDTHRDALLRLHLTHLVAGRYPDFFMLASAEVRSAYIAGAIGLLEQRFPGWRVSPVCAALWPSRALRQVSTHGVLLRLFCRLPRRVYLAVLARLGAFDPLR
jgi:glycosyltransferase involved in cell wall biosynthesis